MLESFGTDRLMFGSDWPVCTTAATYGEVFGVLDTYFRNFSEAEREKIFGANAVGFYGL